MTYDSVFIHQDRNGSYIITCSRCGLKTQIIRNKNIAARAAKLHNCR